MSLDELNQNIKSSWEAEKYDEAINTAQDAASLAEKLYGSTNPKFTAALKNVGRLFLARCNYEQAETFFVKAFDIEKESLGLSHNDTLQTMIELTKLYNLLQSYGQSEEYALLAVDTFESNPDLNRIQLPYILYYLGIAQFYRGVYESSLDSFHRALDLLKDQKSPDPELEGSILFNEGLVHVNQKEYDLAIATLEQAYMYDKENLDKDHPNLARDLFKLADAYRLQGRFEKAKGSLLEYIDLIHQTCGEEETELVSGLHHLAQVHVELQEFREAESAIRSALRIAKKVFEKNSREEGALLGALADILLKQGRNQEASKYLHDSQRIMAIHTPTINAR